MPLKTLSLSPVIAVWAVIGTAGCGAENVNGKPATSPLISVSPVGSLSGDKASTSVGTPGAPSSGVEPGKGTGTDGVAVSPSSANTDPTRGPDSETPVTNPVAWINENGDMPAGSNPFGAVGVSYAFGDGVTSTAAGHPHREGMYCITGDAPGDEDYDAYWGAGLGLDSNGDGGEKLPYELAGQITGLRMKLVGTVPVPARVHFVSDLETAGPIDLCIAEFEPIYDPTGAKPAAKCGSTTQSGWATDGDLDVTVALIHASCKWGGTFEPDAKNVITTIKDTSIEACNGNLLVKPGNFEGCSGTERHTNPSYLATGYFKVFGELTENPSWTTLVDDSYELLAALHGRMNGLVPDWSGPPGNIPSGDRGQYGRVASRTPRRVATDYVWYAEPRAVSYLDNVAAYVESSGGIARSQTPNSNYRGALA